MSNRIIQGGNGLNVSMEMVKTVMSLSSANHQKGAPSRLLTSVQSFRSGTTVSVGLILIVFSSIRLFREFPPRKRRGVKGSDKGPVNTRLKVLPENRRYNSIT